MAISGYSDRINHALAFAAKHHDQQVRRGVRLPYLTQPANVAIILTRYGRSDDTVVAGILLNVVKDYVNEGYSTELLQQRIGEKFGAAVLQTAIAAIPRRSGANGVERFHAERRADFLGRLADVPDEACWVVAADALHDSATVLADVRRTIERDVVWSRRVEGASISWYRDLARGLRSAGFTASIVDELQDVVDALEQMR